ncbi:VOC family protein [Shouchella clausii]|uniref:VOC family protein n=1 Tax=Shouchella clausii TaxID=79880 RepID=UPI000797C4AC|nr:VOC family protein [Shouchella clausii]KKI86243.1 hypothetical protein WZ76_11275 [Shouchella clausii]MCM3312523.1 VOC family protein [Psychrobacillus sp. MER TA 17]PAD18048.1 hypothetical protein CHH73_06995 [Shouchella clausii]PAD48527.1 hypothetical protein CHI09_00710 [Shouchella clausii]
MDHFQIDHIAIAVPSLNTSLPLFEQALQATASHEERLPHHHINAVFINGRGVGYELIEPHQSNVSLQRFLAKQNNRPAFHHIAFSVANIETAIGMLKEKHVRLTSELPLIGSFGRKVAFIHPSSTGGLLVELCEGKT